MCSLINIKQFGIIICVLSGIALLVLFYISYPTLPKITDYNIEQPRNGEYVPGGADCKPDAVARISNHAVRAAVAQRCADIAETYRLQTNDLIQQTRSADSARAQTNLTFQLTLLAYLQTVGGFIVLGAAVAAAVYAREAAQQAKRAADAAHEDLNHSRETSGKYILDYAIGRAH